MRWRLSFPLVAQPFTGRQVLVLSAHSIPVPGGGTPTHAEATAYALDPRERDGFRLVHLVVTLAELAGAPRVTLVQADELAAPAALLYDWQGRVIHPREGHA